ncbi:hypothetical protein MN116_008024 [Schistosoma mekongi]|uniref:Uncharacterized protein n=1 Tax=Schistosoma mekongi TaxID=38744 RepID=A0AAE1Z791_SCHME|nr:hypothetical protein MN116_008024 [Schistosoma mekongi]
MPIIVIVVHHYYLHFNIYLNNMITETMEEDNTNKSLCNEMSSNEQISIEDNNNDSCKLLFTKLWGNETAEYFLNPNFQKISKIQTNSNRTSIINEANEHLLLGGYPNGMLHGARIPFRSNLKSWLFNIQINDKINNQIKQCYTTNLVNTTTNTTTNLRSRSNSVFNLIDLLKYHMGTNYGAQYLWHLLRHKSYEQLINFEKHLTKEQIVTFSAYTHDNVLHGNKNPPLCDFIRINPSHKLINVMKQLKASDIEKQLRKINLSVSWANRNQDQFRIISFQQDLKDAIKSIEANNFDSSSLNDQFKEQFDINLKMNHQKANQLISICPTLQMKQQATFIDNDFQPLENFFPEYTKLQNPIKKEVISSNHHVTSSIDKIRKSKVNKSFNHLTFWNKSQIMKSNNKSIDINNNQSINNKQTKDLHHAKSSIQQNIISMSSLPKDNKLQPLCWSDLFQQNHSEVIQLSSLLSKDNSTNEINSTTGFIKKSIWRPANSIVS